MTNSQEPATKQDLADLGVELRSEIKQLRADMKAMEDRLVESFRDVQPEPLKAFYNFTESNRQRVVQIEGNQGALITRLGVLEDRMLELERKLLFRIIRPGNL